MSMDLAKLKTFGVICALFLCFFVEGTFATCSTASSCQPCVGDTHCIWCKIKQDVINSGEYGNQTTAICTTGNSMGADNSSLCDTFYYLQCFYTGTQLGNDTYTIIGVIVIVAGVIIICILVCLFVFLAKKWREAKRERHFKNRRDVEMTQKTKKERKEKKERRRSNRDTTNDQSSQAILLSSPTNSSIVSSPSPSSTLEPSHTPPMPVDLDRPSSEPQIVTLEEELHSLNRLTPNVDATFHDDPRTPPMSSVYSKPPTPPGSFIVQPQTPGSSFIQPTTPSESFISDATYGSMPSPASAPSMTLPKSRAPRANPRVVELSDDEVLPPPDDEHTNYQNDVD